MNTSQIKANFGIIELSEETKEPSSSVVQINESEFQKSIKEDKVLDMERYYLRFFTEEGGENQTENILPLDAEMFQQI